MIEAEIYKEDGRFYWNLFLRTGIMGGGADSLKEKEDDLAQRLF